MSVEDLVGVELAVFKVGMFVVFVVYVVQFVWHHVSPTLRPVIRALRRNGWFSGGKHKTE